MLKQYEWENIKSLFDVGLSVPQIAQRIGRSTTTIYKFIKNSPPKFKQKEDKIPNKIQEFVIFLDKRMRNGVINCKKLYQELIEQGYRGSNSLLYRYLKYRKAQQIIIHHKPSTRFETKPGEQAQVDWGSFGKIQVNGRVEKLYCFVYVLGYSRTSYIEFTIKQNQQTFQESHINAFEKLGIPKTIVYDNMKTVVLKRDKLPGGKQNIHYNPAFLEFARYYGFKVEATPPYWPRAKGKVEATVKYIRNNFMQGMKFGEDFSSLLELNEKAKHWLVTQANVRLHKTTERRPIDLWKEEKQVLNFPDILPRFKTSTFIEKRVTQNGLVEHKKNFYSVPIHYARKKVYLKEKSENGSVLIQIYFEDKMIAIHPLSYERGRLIINEGHLQNFKNNKFKNQTEKPSVKYKKQKNLITEDFHRPLSYYEFLIPEELT